MPSTSLSITILGAGPAGLRIASRLLRRRDLDLDLTIVEKHHSPGGIAASFLEEGIWLDYGSHRLHPATPQDILDDIEKLIAPSLLKRKRNGRIRLQGRYLKFPLQPLDCLLRLPPSFVAGILQDILKKPFRPAKTAESFADMLLQGLGPTICRNFYFPYAQKLWGCPPEEIDMEQARKRVSAGSISKIIHKMSAFLPGFRKQDTGIFYYPEQGIGQISTALAEEVITRGGEILYNTELTAIQTTKSAVSSISLKTENGSTRELQSSFIFSTIPISRTVPLLSLAETDPATVAARTLHSRSMIFFYLLMNCDQWQPVDAHYFPEEEYLFSRISEGKNYTGSTSPAGKTIICCEIPCRKNDELWLADDEQLKKRVLEDLQKAGIPAGNLQRVFSRRKTDVYPVYRIGYPKQLKIIEKQLSRTEGLISLGRQGLFTHDNIHHSMMMADRAVRCLTEKGEWNRKLWEQYCDEFASYVVED